MDNAVGTNPKEVHIHIKRIPISDIPLSETEVSTWLVNAFSSKDELLRHFYKEGVFPGTPVEGELSTISGLLNFFAILICTGLLLWFMLIPSVWIRVYLAFSFLLLVGSTYFGYKPKSLFGTRFQCWCNWCLGFNCAYINVTQLIWRHSNKSRMHFVSNPIGCFINLVM